MYMRWMALSKPGRKLSVADSVRTIHLRSQRTAGVLTARRPQRRIYDLPVDRTLGFSTASMQLDISFTSLIGTAAAVTNPTHSPPASLVLPRPQSEHIFASLLPPISIPCTICAPRFPITYNIKPQRNVYLRPQFANFCCGLTILTRNHRNHRNHHGIPDGPHRHPADQRVSVQCGRVPAACLLLSYMGGGTFRLVEKTTMSQRIVLECICTVSLSMWMKAPAHGGIKVFKHNCSDTAPAYSINIYPRSSPIYGILEFRYMRYI
ncbi:hypothetical protein K440DRAFT_294689 [Wilcoxina mikolae CBS 423.85]|nr:hypothetical protein K440DRAFT_294689 [Wilcoxina mikolae CBS 423.85]